MKLKFDQSLSSANGWTDLEAQTFEAFKFLFLSTEQYLGVIIKAPFFDNISGVPEFMIIEDRQRHVYSDAPDALLLTRNIDLVSLWLEKGELIASFDSNEVLKHEINYKNSIIELVVLEAKVTRADEKSKVFYLSNTFCVRFRTGRFAGESFFLIVTFEVTPSSSTIPNVSICLTKLKSNQFFDASGLLLLE